MESFSVTIIATNRSVILPQCLDTAKKISDDVVIVTNADHEFTNFADQKNYAISRCLHNWVLSLDADESLSPELILEIKNLDLSDDAYTIPRVNYIFGKSISHTNWSPENDRHVWLFDKTKCYWEGAVHEHVRVNGTIGHLRGPKVHYNYQTVEQFVDKMNHYTTFEAQNRKFSYLSLITYPIWKFVRHYFIYLGFLDGWHGLFLSYLQAVYGLSVYVKAWFRTVSPSLTSPSSPLVEKN